MIITQIIAMFGSRPGGGGGGGGGGTKNPAPTAFISDTYNQTFLFTKADDFPLITDYEYSLDSGATWTDNWFLTASGRQAIPYGTYSIGQIKVRTKATTGFDPSDPISNAVAYTITGSNTGKVNMMNRGDSISTNIDGMGYSWQLEDSLDGSKFILPMYHSALSGRRASDFAYGTNSTSDEIAAEKTYFNEAVSRNICIYMLGTNDIVYQFSDGTTMTDIENAEKVCIKRLRDRGFFVLLLIPPEPGHQVGVPDDQMFYPNYGLLRTWMLGAWQTELGAIDYVDWYAHDYVMQYRSEWSSYWGDNIHWNGAGGMTVAAGILQPILEALETRVSLIPPAPAVTFDYTAKTMTLILDDGYSMEDYLYTTDGMDTMHELTSLTVSVTPGTTANKAGFYRRSINKNTRSLVTYNGSSF